MENAKPLATLENVYMQTKAKMPQLELIRNYLTHEISIFIFFGLWTLPHIIHSKLITFYQAS